jgi:cytochrome c556
MMSNATLIALTLAAGVAATVSAQRVNSSDEFRQAMKTIGSAMNAGTRAITDRDNEGAKAPLVLARQTLTASVPFWTQKKVEEAVKLTKATVQKLDDLDSVLSAPSPDAAAIANAMASVGEACRTCHTAYRDGDSKSGYRIKSGI